jgi:hypothetical protein
MTLNRHKPEAITAKISGLFIQIRSVHLSIYDTV